MGNTEHYRNLVCAGPGGTSHANIANHVHGQRSATIYITLLGEHVLCVVAKTAHEQMCGPNAQPVVALVQHAFAIQERTVLDFPRIAVGRHKPCWLRRNCEFAVAAKVTSAAPIPAPITIALLYFRPEAIGRRNRSRFVPARRTAEQADPASKFVGPTEKVGTTEQTRSLNRTCDRIVLHSRSPVTGLPRPRPDTRGGTFFHGLYSVTTEC